MYSYVIYQIDCLYVFTITSLIYQRKDSFLFWCLCLIIKMQKESVCLSLYRMLIELSFLILILLHAITSTMYNRWAKKITAKTSLIVTISYTDSFVLLSICVLPYVRMLQQLRRLTPLHMLRSSVITVRNL